MPKVELHVHIEGSIRPETVLRLAERHGVSLPGQTVSELRDWYRFRDFEHFVQVYVAVSRCIKTPEDIETVFREFLAGQKEQNILHTEATYTACTIEKYAGIPWDEQHDAIERARLWASRELGVTLGVILDIVRGDPVERAAEVYSWVQGSMGKGVVALGIAGMEWLGTTVYKNVFDQAQKDRVPVIAHAGETTGPETIWDALEHCGALRIGHGVRCFEDPALVEHLLKQRTHLEVSPTSNVCLGVFPSLADHPVNRMVETGLNISINSDDPPMFSTTHTEEWERCCRQFGWTDQTVARLVDNAIEASLTSPDEKQRLRSLTAGASGQAVC